MRSREVKRMSVDVSAALRARIEEARTIDELSVSEYMRTALRERVQRDLGAPQPRSNKAQHDQRPAA
jgi:Arc/MetJ family transcription regulator